VARLPGLVVGVAALAFAVTTFWDRDEGFADLLADATQQQRQDTIRAGIAMFADNPLLGVGPGCSVIGWPEYAPPNAFSEGWLHSHNTVIQLFSETGLLGAVPFFLLLGIALWRTHAQSRLWRAAGWPGRSRMVSALAISLWGLAVCGLSGGYMLSWFPYLILGLASATLLLPGPGEEEEGAEDDDEAWR
jgi:O-antigen ligase